MSASASPTDFVPLYELFLASVRRRPDHPAIQRQDVVLTYAQLHDRAVEHCFRLRRAGVERGSVVGILLAPGVDFVATALATLRIGGVYLPLDPRWPAARIRMVLCDAAAGAVVVSGRAPASGWADDLPGTVVVDLADGAAPVVGGEAPATDISPRELAMVIYTSGSTGTPKGSMIEQGSVCRLVRPDQRLAIIEQDRVAQHANPAFDATTYEIWCTLAAGATLVLAPEGVTLGPNEYAELFGRCTAALIPSGLFAELARVGPCRDAIGGLRLLAVGGDVLDPSAAARLEGAGSRFNVYGPTETTVAAALGPLDARSDRGSVPIGTPLEGTWCYVLDENLDQVRPGGEGELVIGGAGVGRGYLGQPGLTASRYLPDPCVPGRRAYATGDRVRLLADGSLDFLGRQDQQVKVNGFRVELGEIEAVLRRHPAVGSARVLARAADGRRELVAAVESDRTDRAAVVSQLRTLIGETLPPYMHPRDIVVTDAFPLSPNGKFDFDALFGSRHDVSAGPRPADAEHSVLHRVRRIWTEILDRPVAEDGSFFDLGGDSLLVIRLLFQVEDELGVALQPVDLFDHPELSDFAALVAEAVGGDAGPALDETARGGPRPAPRPERIPLAYAQQRLWFLNRFEDTGALYNVPLAFRLRGALDRAALADALNDVVARHEILRTVFPELPDGTPVQRVLSVGPRRFAFTYVEVDEAGLSAVLSAAAAQPFDLTADPPLRVVVCRMADEEHVLLLVAHHIAVDGASYGPLMRDLSRAYAARARGQAPDWTPPAVQYADYALWQRGVLGDPDSPDARLADQQSFWTRELAGIPDQLKLPTDRPRPAESAHLGARVPVTIGVELRRALAGLAEREKATVFMALQAGLAGVLHRLGAGADIPIGSPVAGRRATATDDMVGFFLNTLVLRTSLEGDPTFRELLGRVRTTDLAAFAHQDLPFERVVDAVGPERSLARHPLFQVMLAYLADTEVTLDLVGLGAEREAVRLEALSYDLALHLNDLRDRDALDGFLVYDPALFDEATAVGLTRRFERLLTAAVAAPDTRISALDLLSDEEAGSLIARGTGRERDRRPELLPTLFARQAARTPAAVAVVDEHGETTYAVLARLVERYAAGLSRLGVGPGAVVGVYADRECETLACLLGVLAAGGAYLPLDPGYPAERIRLMIEDSGAPLVLVGSGLDADFIDVKHRVVRLDSPELLGPETAQPDRIAPSPSPQDLAYVIYTSGSTGRPKGVMITHDGLANYLAWCVEELRDAVSQGSLVHSSLSFDFTVPGLYGPLLTGGTVRFLPKGAGLPELASALAEPGFRIGLLRLTPSLADALADHLADRSTALDAHSIVVGGEGFRLALRERLRLVAPTAAVYNHYGPTEAVVARGIFRLLPDWTPDARATTLPIDSPLPGTRIYLLDDGLSLVAPGVDGEVYLGGDGLARGYLGRPGLTAERFLPDPFAGDGRRMFRTGDLGRWTASGGIEILGRTDSQTKIRGYRVEPGEAEAALNELPDVARAAVVVARSSSGEPALVGYAVLSEGSDADAAALRAQLVQRLPGYLVPSMIELLDAIPLSPNGKLDRAALPAVRRESAPPPSVDDASPLTGLVCRLFARTLGHTSVGPEDNFFELGGNSLLSIRLVGEIRRATGVDLPLRAVFEAQTPADVVSRVQGSARSAAAPDLEAEAVLDADFTLDAVPAIGAERLKDPRAVLLTGATGFLGAFLLRAVLDRTGADVHCLVRAGDDAEAAARLERSLRRYLLWDDALAPRILPVAGDLGRPLLGLDASRFDQLAETVDAIYHCGARVSAAEPYERLKAANVSGTREVIRLAGRRRRIPLHHVSTITTLLSDTENEGVLAEDRRVPAGSVPAIGYAQSKWVAEELVRAAVGRGLPAAIYRPGRICGHTRTGAMGPDDAFWYYVRACIELQAAPEPRRQFAAANLIPVDYVADAIVRLAHHHAPEGSAFNLVNDADTTLSAVLDRVRAAGYPVADLPYDPWLARLSGIAEREDAADGGSLSAAALIAGLAHERAEGAAARYGHARTDGALDGSDVVRPQVDDAVVDRQLRYLAETGFLPPAPGR